MPDISATLMTQFTHLIFLLFIFLIIPVLALLTGIDASRRGRTAVEVILWVLLTALVFFIGVPLYLFWGRKPPAGEKQRSI
ncbi:PLD nuclease N-terminal domain-containing protein [Desulfotomaculum copahuensis]|uniref:Cardiolipin synthase N-terminal domain-containing protein n=1 Tax=Desulfotomaculum copahuensis TaxID=1838280 RepID=A0A1B7LEQ4_9FIRM|nr:PLD nuclease N-terminal domain-containing protein [Desulfotomaculum copahuensis]OAT81748.1 hypothetical protein A6M21_10100 [Desulfotomaculum copahuensis]